MSFQLTSRAIKEGQPIPELYTGDGRDISPPLAWSGAPPGTKTYTLICDDPDAPRGTFTHWVAFNLPLGQQVLGEGTPTSATLPDGAGQGTNDFGNTGYGGPAPPPGKPHRYFFKLYAVDQVLPVKAGATRQQVLSALQGHILAETQLMGTYGRKVE